MEQAKGATRGARELRPSRSERSWLSPGRASVARASARGQSRGSLLLIPPPTRAQGGPGDKDKVAELSPGSKVEHDEDVGAVIVGFDRHVNYFKIQNAQLCINENVSPEGGRAKQAQEGVR